jgi:hypothetical protein
MGSSDLFGDMTPKDWNKEYFGSYDSTTAYRSLRNVQRWLGINKPESVVKGMFKDPHLPTRGMDAILETKVEEILWGKSTLQILVSPTSAVELMRARIRTSKFVPEIEVWAWNTQKQSFEVNLRFEDPFDPDDYHAALEEGAFDD